MRNSVIYIIILIILSTGCARSYRKIDITSVPFKDFREDENISYAVRQGVMYNMKNFFYAKKELKKDISLIAFNIVNKSESAININDLRFSCGATVPIAPIKTDEFYDAVKQKSGLYWLYSLGVIVYPKPGKNDDKTFIPIPFGVVMGAANFGIAYRANKKLNKDLSLLDLTNKMIQPGDSIKGVLPFKSVANCGDIFISVKDE